MRGKRGDATSLEDLMPSRTLFASFGIYFCLRYSLPNRIPP
ncbi:hypothetical protein LSO9J_80031 [Candidatus Liberibacter solanacearum]